MATPKGRSETVKALDRIEHEVYKVVREFGFTKHGRTLHRFVAGDISQVIDFQLGQAYAGANHLLSVNVAIRVPECANHAYDSQMPQKAYYREYECNIRSRLGTVEGKKEACYDLRQSMDAIFEDILRQIRDIVLPAFDVLSSREAILQNRRNYPEFDWFAHLILRDEAMMHRYLGDVDKAERLYNEYMNKLILRAQQSDATLITRKSWVTNALALAQKLNLLISQENCRLADAFIYTESREKD